MLLLLYCIFILNGIIIWGFGLFVFLIYCRGCISFSVCSFLFYFMCFCSVVSSRIARAINGKCPYPVSIMLMISDNEENLFETLVRCKPACIECLFLIPHCKSPGGNQVDGLPPDHKYDFGVGKLKMLKILSITNCWL